MADQPARLKALHAGTSAAFAGTAAPGIRSGRWGVVAATGSLPAFADDHLAGFAMDVHGRSCRTMAETLDYCYHVAGVVGLMMAWVMGVRDRAVLARASDLGMALEVDSIARGVGDDARWPAASTCPPTGCAPKAPVVVGGRRARTRRGQRVARVVALLDDAERFYDSAWHGIPPPALAVRVGGGHRASVYRDIGRAVRRPGRGGVGLAHDRRRRASSRRWPAPACRC
ncbi:MAG: squalene/phytoene synthase family protein [Vicinamibacterales bacterium]